MTIPSPTKARMSPTNMLGRRSSVKRGYKNTCLWDTCFNPGEAVEASYVVKAVVKVQLKSEKKFVVWFVNSWFCQLCWLYGALVALGCFRCWCDLLAILIPGIQDVVQVGWAVLQRRLLGNSRGQEYLDQERSKGRKFDEIYTEASHLEAGKVMVLGLKEVAETREFTRGMVYAFVFFDMRSCWTSHQKACLDPNNWWQTDAARYSLTSKESPGRYCCLLGCWPVLVSSVDAWTESFLHVYPFHLAAHGWLWFE